MNYYLFEYSYFDNILDLIYQMKFTSKNNLLSIKIFLKGINNNNNLLYLLNYLLTNK